MDVVFTSPAGFWALLGVPAVLAIHFLQRESRRVRATTLFLVEGMAPASASGRRLERLRSSLPLWLQLAVIGLLATILAGPRAIRPDSVQCLAVVLDSSLSMEAFRAPLRAALARRLPELARAARKTEFTLLETDRAGGTLYRGEQVSGLLAALDAWQPRLGGHDVAPALNLAARLLPPGGTVIFATDHPQPVPAGVEVLAVGSPLANVGFAGLRADEAEWTALVINASDAPQTRDWWIETEAGRSAPARLALAPGEIKPLRGRYAAARQTLVLAGDAFSVDDRLPLVRPVPKRLRLAVANGVPFFDRLVASLRNVDRVAENPDLALAVDDPLRPAPLPEAGLVFVRDLAPAPGFVPGEIVAADHPLTRDLSWSGLLCRDTFTTPAKPGDEVLVWAGRRPLIILRNEGRLLVFNFDLTQSNADRLPAVVLLLDRFVEARRAAKIAPAAINVELDQRLEPDGQRAPARPGFFVATPQPANAPLSAAHFADPREADFRAAAARDPLGARAAAILREPLRSEDLGPWLVLAMLGLVLANWAAGTLASRRGEAAPVTP